MVKNNSPVPAHHTDASCAQREHLKLPPEKLWRLEQSAHLDTAGKGKGEASCPERKRFHYQI